MVQVNLLLSDRAVAALLELTEAEQEKCAAAAVQFPRESKMFVAAGEKIKEVCRNSTNVVDTSQIPEDTMLEFVRGLHYTLEKCYLQWYIA